ncbi:MAG: hypothetical protein ABIF10_00880 [Candidatus Woesearchaeota archaeon]
MALGSKQLFILFSLGQYYLEANKRLKGLPLQIVISKKVFIDIMKQAHIAEKKERALYRNLEVLEDKKYVSYENHCLKLTRRGQSLFSKLDMKYSSYMNLAKVLSNTDVTKYTKKAQTVFK